jgi:hypothetical protein
VSTTVTLPQTVVNVVLQPWGALVTAAMVPALLAEALVELKVARRELRELVDAKSGQRQAVDYVIEAAAGRRIGVRGKGDATELVVVGGAGDVAAVQPTIDRVRQAYARVKVIHEVKRQGYRLAKEERLPDGSLRVVVQRWQ